MDARRLAPALNARQSGEGWVARCPTHNDRTPSLSISETEEGRVLVHCHAGCEQLQVIQALRHAGHWPWLQERRSAPATVRGRPARKGASDLALGIWQASTKAA